MNSLHVQLCRVEFRCKLLPMCALYTRLAAMNAFVLPLRAFRYYTPLLYTHIAKRILTFKKVSARILTTKQNEENLPVMLENCVKVWTEKIDKVNNENVKTKKWSDDTEWFVLSIFNGIISLRSWKFWKFDSMYEFFSAGTSVRRPKVVPVAKNPIEFEDSTDPPHPKRYKAIRNGSLNFPLLWVHIS